MLPRLVSNSWTQWILLFQPPEAQITGYTAPQLPWKYLITQVVYCWSQRHWSSLPSQWNRTCMKWQVASLSSSYPRHQQGWPQWANLYCCPNKDSCIVLTDSKVLSLCALPLRSYLFNFSRLISFLGIHILATCMTAHHVWAWCPQKSERVSDALSLELQMALIYYVGYGDWTWVCCKRNKYS